MINSTKKSKTRHNIPEDGPGGPKHVGASIEIF